MVFEEFDPRTRVIFTAENFGRSRKANQAVIRAHRDGVLTCASLGVRNPFLDEAVALARENPGLEIGLQLVLVEGKSVLKPSEIIGVVDERFEFAERYWSAVLRYALNPRLRHALQAEVDAQFRLFRRTGLPLGFVSGRRGLHLHPTIFSFLRRYYQSWKVTAIQATRDPVMTHLRVEPGRTWSRVPRGVVGRSFDRWARPSLERRGLKTTDYVLGYLAEDRIDEDYLFRMLDQLPPGTYEVRCQPDEEAHADELELLVSPTLKAGLQQRGIEVIRHADL